jgi:tRNA(Arg) A34 adenosine deaminase TadA/predicted GNAT family N-acyltransferase
VEMPEIAPQVLEALSDALVRATRAGEVPVAAAVVRDGEILSVAHNTCIAEHDPSAHAEIVALREAGKRAGNYRLEGATVYVTLEPCAMCAGALLHARVKQVVFGAHDEKFGAAGSVVNLFANAVLNAHSKDVGQHAALAEMGVAALQTFFATKRAQPKVPAFEVVDASWQTDAAALTKIRFEVFVHEQKIPADSEIDAHDPLSDHVIARIKKDGMPIATGRLLPDGHIGRMAVLKAYRSTGAGMAVLQFLIEKAKQKGFKEAQLSAQTYAMPFYERAGFVGYGEEYDDCGIPHRMMRRALDS